MIEWLAGSKTCSGMHVEALQAMGKQGGGAIESAKVHAWTASRKGSGPMPSCATTHCAVQMLPSSPGERHGLARALKLRKLCESRRGNPRTCKSPCLDSKPRAHLGDGLITLRKCSQKYLHLLNSGAFRIAHSI